MNSVHLTGNVASQPVQIQRAEQIPHAVFQLRVDHRKINGEIVRELYTINAWHKTADWATARLKPGAEIAVNGYLTQRMEQGRMLTEVTAQEFFVPRLPLPQTGGEDHGHDADLHP